MNQIQNPKTTPSQPSIKATGAPTKPSKITAYTQEELKRSIERKTKRKTELLNQIQKLDEKIAARQARLQELNRKVN